jgi:hypothetical protein
MYRNNPVIWQKASDSTKDASSGKNIATAKSPKKDVRKPKAKKEELMKVHCC